jgi:hypothetical protein
MSKFLLRSAPDAATSATANHHFAPAIRILWP